MKTIQILALIGLLLTGATAPAAANRTLQDFGGCEGVARMAAEFVGRVVQDGRINFYFAKADGGRLIKLLSCQICEALGGPCKYTGRNMKDMHRGMGITTAQFNAIVEDLCDAMDHLRIPARSQSKLLGKLAPMWRDIVTR